MLRLRLVGDLGQVLFMPYELRDEASIKKAMRHSNVVINLIGRDWETKNFTFDDIYVHGPARIARLAKECGVEKLIHVSSLNAEEYPEPLMLPGGSKILKSKFKGEQIVRDIFPDAVVFRPSDIYGSEDRFLRYVIIHCFLCALLKNCNNFVRLQELCQHVAPSIPCRALVEEGRRDLQAASFCQ